MAVDPYVDRTLDNYKILKLLGRGGMGAVYLARDMTLQREVAVKIMHPRVARRPDFRVRFLEEARAAARMEHSGIVKVYHFGDKDTLYIVMEYIPGGNLNELLTQLRAQNKWISLPEALEIVRQVALALDYAHSQGVLHRDIKPENIMMRTGQDLEGGLDYQPVVTDLGLAQLAGAAGESSGTPAYISPEQAMGDPVDARSDIYSLGILLYELVTGTVPFPAMDLEQAKVYHARRRPPAPSTHRPDLPKNVEEIILRALNKQPDKRFPTARALAQAIVGVPADSVRASVLPGAKAGVASIGTQLQESMLPGRQPDLLRKFGDFKPPTPNEFYIQLLTPDGQTRAVSLADDKSFTIGRSSENDLTLDDDRASRVHVIVESDGRKLKVVDQNSRNGTYLDDRKLLASVPEDWPPDKILRVGKHYLRQVPPRQGTMRAVESKPQSGRGTVDIVPAGADSAGDVHLRLEPAELTVSPGGEATLQVSITNDSEQVAYYQIRILGVPAEWITMHPTEVELLPTHRGNVLIAIRPPQSMKTRAGRFRLEVEASGVGNSAIPNLRAQAKLNITGFGQLATELRQNRANVGSKLPVYIRNDSNQPASFHLACWDDANELNFIVAQEDVTLPAAAAAALEFSARLRHRRWLGGPKEHPFNIKITSSGGQEQAHRGVFISRGLIPPWLPPVLGVLLVAIIAAAGYFIRSRQQAFANATATTTVVRGTEIAKITSTVVASTETAEVEATITAGTSTARAVATETSIAGATATTVYLADDLDKDGIINSEELRLGLKIDVADSDTDGLSDGDELVRDTLPLVADTDGEGLKDGEEVRLGTNPKLVDTDGDGDPDNTDDFPLEPPTVTPTPTATPNETATAAIFAGQTATSQATETARAELTMTREAIQTATSEARGTLTRQEQLEGTSTQAAKETQVRQEQIVGTQTAEMKETEAGQKNDNATMTQEAKEASETAGAQTATAEPPTPTATATPSPLTLDAFNAYCVFKDPSFVSATLDNNVGAFGWGCRDILGIQVFTLEIEDYDEACQLEFGADFRAISLNPNLATAWVCVRDD